MHSNFRENQYARGTPAGMFYQATVANLLACRTADVAPRSFQLLAFFIDTCRPPFIPSGVVHDARPGNCCYVGVFLWVSKVKSEVKSFRTAMAAFFYIDLKPHQQAACNRLFATKIMRPEAVCHS